MLIKKLALPITVTNIMSPSTNDNIAIEITSVTGSSSNIVTFCVVLSFGKMVLKELFMKNVSLKISSDGSNVSPLKPRYESGPPLSMKMRFLSNESVGEKS